MYWQKPYFVLETSFALAVKNDFKIADETVILSDCNAIHY
jgi:hypothetical protein